MKYQIVKARCWFFLRHFGCIFCREALHDIAELKPKLDAQNINLTFVHMSTEETAQSFFDQFNLKNVMHISDPQCELYAQFGLTKGTFTQLMGLRTWMGGFRTRKKGIHISAQSIGDSLQMPGIFILCNGAVAESYIHKVISDKPDYEYLINCCKPRKQ